MFIETYTLKQMNTVCICVYEKLKFVYCYKIYQNYYENNEQNIHNSQKNATNNEFL